MNKIHELCIITGTSISKLEKELKFGNGTIHKWVKSYPSIDKIKKVADFFNVSIDFIIGRSSLSTEAEIIAGSCSKLSAEKQELVKQYLFILQQN